jgi:hypothetical protein
VTSETWRHIVWQSFSDVSEDCTDSILRVDVYVEHAHWLLSVPVDSDDRSSSSPESPKKFYQATRRHNPEDSTLHGQISYIDGISLRTLLVREWNKKKKNKKSTR